MSKVDAMRALREARHAAASKAAPAPRVAARAAAPAAARVSASPATPAAEAAPAEALCGHRNMGGRSCTREADHVKNGTKNHRYG